MEGMRQSSSQAPVDKTCKCMNTYFFYSQAQRNEKESKTKKNKLLVAAIDFGTTYSGYAFSWMHDWRTVQVQKHTSEKFVSSKAPTVLLLKPDRSFLAFGYGAENAFKDMTTDSNSNSDSDSEEATSSPESPKNWKDYYYFQRFKMLLHKDEVRIVFFKEVL